MDLATSPPDNNNIPTSTIYINRAPSPPLPPPPTLDTFLETQKYYFDTLSAEEKAALPSCQSSAQLIRELRNLGVFSRTDHERRLRNSLGKVQRFTEKLEPYFDAMGIIIQSHPEIAGIIWGSIRSALLVILYGSSLRKEELTDQSG